MNISEVGDMFNCDCGFSWVRGQSGAHSCGDGLRKQITELKAERNALAAENARCKFEISRCHQAVDEMFKQREKWVDAEWLSAVWATSKRLKENT